MQRLLLLLFLFAAFACAQRCPQGYTLTNGVCVQNGGIPSTQLVGILQAANEPAHTGDMTNAAGSLATTVKGLNGVALSGLPTGLLAVTTATGAPRAPTTADLTALISSAGGTTVSVGGGGGSNTGSSNVFLGQLSGFSNTNGATNTFIGAQAGYTNVSGASGVFVGTSAGVFSIGSNNTFLGSNTGNGTGATRVTTDDHSTFLGYGATKNNAAALTNAMAIGNGAQVLASNQAVIGNTAVTDVFLGGTGAAISHNAGTIGPATAPTGACTTTGAWVFSQDGHATFCPSGGTWATKI